MKKNPSVEEIRAMLARGELPVPAGTTLDDLSRLLEFKLSIAIAGLMGIPVERVKVTAIQEDLGMPEKMGIVVSFDPEITEAERPVFEWAMRIAAAALGSRPPIRPASA